VATATFTHPLHLVGRYVELVPLDSAQLPQLAPRLEDWPTVEHLRGPPESTPASTRAWVGRWLDLGRSGAVVPFATTLRATGEAIGMTSFLRLDRASRAVEIGGTWVDRSYWRTPVNTDAKWVMLRYAFEEAGLHRVQFQTDARNVRSQTAIAGLGATPEARLREDVLRPDGSYRTSVYFSILEEEWPAVRARLEARLARPWAGRSEDPVGRAGYRATDRFPPSGPSTGSVRLAGAARPRAAPRPDPCRGSTGDLDVAADPAW
jgi:RimJ/RimL family protein N-acetyltransferase